MKILVILIITILSGCATTEPPVAPSVLIKNTYLIPSLGPDIIELPKNVRPLDLTTATQADLAKWLLENEKRVVELEGKVAAARNISGLLIKKNSLKPDDYKIIELTKKDLTEAK